MKMIYLMEITIASIPVYQIKKLFISLLTGNPKMKKRQCCLYLSRTKKKLMKTANFSQIIHLHGIQRLILMYMISKEE